MTTPTGPQAQEAGYELDDQTIVCVIEQASEIVGQGPGAWDMVDTVELVRAILSSVPAPPARVVSDAELPVELSGRRPSAQSLWQAFWAIKQDDPEWVSPKDAQGKDIPVNVISFKCAVVQLAFELDEKHRRSADQHTDVIGYVDPGDLQGMTLGFHPHVTLWPWNNGQMVPVYDRAALSSLQSGAEGKDGERMAEALRRIRKIISGDGGIEHWVIQLDPEQTLGQFIDTALQPVQGAES